MKKKELIRGIADVTGYIRKSNNAYGQDGFHRVYIEIPGNWQFVIDLANKLKILDIPIQTIDFGHPNLRDSNLKKYNLGKKYYWKKEHQVKIWANEFLPIGFNIDYKSSPLIKEYKELSYYKRLRDVTFVTVCNLLKPHLSKESQKIIEKYNLKEEILCENHIELFIDELEDYNDRRFERYNRGVILVD